MATKAAVRARVEFITDMMQEAPKLTAGDCEELMRIARRLRGMAVPEE